MKIEFSRKEPPMKARGKDEIRKGLPVIRRIIFCCEEMGDEVTQRACWLPTDENNEIWFNHSLVEGEMDYYVRFCPFCGEKVQTVDVSMGITD